MRLVKFRFFWMALAAVVVAAFGISAPANNPGAPSARAGADMVVPFGSRVQLDGLASSAPGGGPLAYTWTLVESPDGGAARLELTDTPQPVLVADQQGRYVVELVVNDGRRASAPDTLVVEARTIDDVKRAQAWVARGSSDVDGDGVPDDMDNCVNTPNPLQIDTNSDGFGNRCDPDLDNDGLITNTIDLGLLRLAFFSTPAAPNWNPDADFTNDDIVNVAELGILRQFFFNPPGPIANTFINPAGGSWHDPANWSLGQVPNPAHSVRIDLNPGVVVEYSTGSSHVHSIRTTSDLLISGGELEITEDVQVNAPFAMTGGRLVEAHILAPTTSDVLAVTGATTFEQVVLAGDVAVGDGAVLIIDNGLTLDNATMSLNSTGGSSTLRFRNVGTQGLFGTGEVVFNGSGSSDSVTQITVDSSVTLSVDPGITIRTGTSGGRLVGSFNTIVNYAGSLVSELAGRLLTWVGGGGTSVLNLEPQAVVTVNDGEFFAQSDFVNNGTINVTGGVLDIGDSSDDDWQNNGIINLTNATLELGGSFTTGALGTINTTGDVVLNGLFNIGGQTVDIGVDLPGNVRLDGGEIIGGVLTGTAISTTSSATATTLNGVTLEADLNVADNSTIRVVNGLTLSGATISLISTGSSSTLRLLSSADPNGLFGSGEVVFNATTASDALTQITVDSSAAVSFDPGITVRTGTSGGRLSGSFNSTVSYAGSIVADLPGRLVTWVGGGGTSALTLEPEAVVTVSGGEFFVQSDIVINGAINVTDGVLDIGDSLDDDWQNNGLITLTNSLLELGGTFTPASIGTINTAGDVVLNGLFDITGLTVDIGVDLPGNVRLGGGEIRGGTLAGTAVSTTPLVAPTTLNGVTLQADLLIVSNSSIRVSNGLTLDGGTITLDSTNASTAVRLLASGGANGLFGTGEVVFNATTTSDTLAQITVDSSQTVDIGAGVTLRTGTSGGRLVGSFNSIVNFAGALVVDVPGRVFAWSGGGGTSVLNILPGATLTVIDAELFFQSDFVNEGTIDVTNGTLDIGDSVDDDWQNNGIINLTSSVLELGGTFGLSSLGTINTTGDVVINGVFDLTGETIDVGTDLPGNLLFNGGEIIGGTFVGSTLVTSSTSTRFNGMTLAADLIVSNASQLLIVNGLTLAGATVTLDANGSTAGLRFLTSTDPTGLFGTGEVVFNNATGSDSVATLSVDSNVAASIASGITVRTGTSGGRLTGSFNSTIEFAGALVADVPGRSVSYSGGGGTAQLTFAAGSTATITDSELFLQSDFVNDGTIDVTNGTLDIGDSVDDDWQNNGVINLTGSVLELGGSFTTASLGSINTAGDVVLNGVFDLTGETLDIGVDLPGNVVFGGGEIVGGTFTGTPLVTTSGFSTTRFDGVTLATDLTLFNGTQLLIENGLTLNSANVVIDSTGSSTTLRFVASAQPSGVFGTGEVVFNATSSSDTLARLSVDANVDMAIAAGVTVRSGTAGGNLVAGFNSTIDVAGRLVSGLAGREVRFNGGAGTSQLTISGALEVAAGASLNLFGPLEIATTGSVALDIGGPTSAAYAQVLAPNQSVTLAGTLDVTLVNGFMPASCDTFDVLTWQTLTGTFDTVNGPDFGGGSTFDVNYQANELRLQVPGACRFAASRL